jgi:hypothetical protein
MGRSCIRIGVERSRGPKSKGGQQQRSSTEKRLEETVKQNINISILKISILLS